MNPSDKDTFEHMLELWFLFSTIWSLGGGVDEDGRKKMDNFIREMEGQFPAKDTVYEYYVDTKLKTWALWEDKLKGTWRYPTKSVIISMKKEWKLVSTLTFSYHWWTHEGKKKCHKCFSHIFIETLIVYSTHS